MFQVASWGITPKATCKLAVAELLRCRSLQQGQVSSSRVMQNIMITPIQTLQPLRKWTSLTYFHLSRPSFTTADLKGVLEPADVVACEICSLNSAS